MSKTLYPHSSCAPRSQVSVNWELNQQLLTFSFTVSSYVPNTNHNFTKSYQDNWGLWDYDVVEVFLKKENTNSYLELQTSPLNQPFALIIEKPREKYFSPKDLLLSIENEVLEQKWKAKITIPISSIPGEGSKIFGNCFACLGKQENREYFALNLNSEQTPDFHRPELFIQLGDLV